MKKLLICFLLLIVMSPVVGCIPGDGKHTEANPAGFFWGVWHGWIAPVSLVWSVFDSDIRLYANNNTGWWYDFGFYIAVISGFGSLSLSRRKRKEEAP